MWHLQYSGWQDHGCPEDVSAGQGNNLMKSNKKSNKKIGKLVELVGGGSVINGASLPPCLVITFKFNFTNSSLWQVGEYLTFMEELSALRRHTVSEVTDCTTAQMHNS